MAIELQQRLDVRKIAPTRWRVVGYAGKAVFFYGEAGTEATDFSVKNELTFEDLGKWRGVDFGRHLIIGFGGNATVAPKPDGQPGELSISFNGVALGI